MLSENVTSADVTLNFINVIFVSAEVENCCEIDFVNDCILLVNASTFNWTIDVLNRFNSLSAMAEIDMLLTAALGKARILEIMSVVENISDIDLKINRLFPIVCVAVTTWEILLLKLDNRT